MNPLARAFSEALLDFVWQGLTVAIVLWIALEGLRRRSPQARYAISCLALAVLAMLPVITTVVLYLDPAPVPAAALSTLTNARAAIAALPSPVLVGLGGDAAGTSWVELLQAWALRCWTVGVLLFSVRLVIGGAHTSVLCGRGEPAQSQVVALVVRLASRIGVNRSIRVRMSERVESPAVIGWLRPLILLPPASLAGLTIEQLETILAHEIAHIRRHDYLVNILQLIVETVLFYHPAVWWTSRQIRREREMCCDDIAVRTCGDPVIYARALSTLARQRLETSAFAMSSTGGTLLARIQRLLGSTASAHSSIRWPGVIVVCGVVSVIALNGALSRAQADVRPTFEVASVKPNMSGSRPMGYMRFWPGGRFTATNVTLLALVESAYHVTRNKGLVTGGPDWLDSARFDIEATPPQGAIPPGVDDRVRVDKSKLMLQVLLEERFALRVRRETKQLPIYELVAARKGPKLPKAADRDCATLNAGASIGAGCHMFQGGAGRGIDGHMVSMLDLSEFLTVFADRVVHDKTNIEGLFDLQTTGWTDPNRRPATDGGNQNREEVFDPHGPSLFTVLEEQLGLRLARGQGPVNAIVIEHAGRPAED
jgi:uncharacterized protein (TIGR03435 family)